MALNHTNRGSENHDPWLRAVGPTRTTPGSPGSQYLPTESRAAYAKMRPSCGLVMVVVEIFDRHIYLGKLNPPF